MSSLFPSASRSGGGGGAEFSIPKNLTNWFLQVESSYRLVALGSFLRWKIEEAKAAAAAAKKRQSKRDEGEADADAAAASAAAAAAAATHHQAKIVVFASTCASVELLHKLFKHAFWPDLGLNKSAA